MAELRFREARIKPFRAAVKVTADAGCVECLSNLAHLAGETICGRSQIWNPSCHSLCELWLTRFEFGHQLAAHTQLLCGQQHRGQQRIDSFIQ